MLEESGKLTTKLNGQIAMFMNIFMYSLMIEYIEGIILLKTVSKQNLFRLQVMLVSLKYMPILL